ncbi:MAG TPA: SWIM zinc finger family protein [Syntrophobacteraceae bacterium]|nr:SWIM zinc finger family protein [Syntrophobacteraceae bacterium]
MSWRYYDHFPRSTPKAAKGGIKAQSKRGGFGNSWWAKRWIAVLESFNIGERLGRGRSYARRGQVLSIDIEKGKVKARVQGSRPRPYEVALQVKVLSPADWRKLAQALSSRILFVAKLLAGEMPQDIEQVFDGAGLSLFPSKSKDLATSCSCPDWSNPCKHIAAVYYLLGEEFDRDPFLIFKLRGMEREELLAGLAQTGKGGSRKEFGGMECPGATEDAAPPLDPICADGEVFWKGSRLPEDLLGEVRIPPLRAALLKRLGGFPFWRGNRLIQEALEPVYSNASQRGMDIFLYESERGPSR